MTDKQFLVVLFFGITVFSAVFTCAANLLLWRWAGWI
jgi:hypothetical protein